MDVALTAVIALTISKMSNDILAASNLALTGFDRIAPENLAFETMKKAGLIQEDGKAVAKKELLSALTFEIDKRVRDGTFL